MKNKIKFNKIIEIIMYVLQIGILAKILFSGLMLIFPNSTFLSSNVYIQAYLGSGIVGMDSVFGCISGFVVHIIYLLVFHQIGRIASEMKKGIKFTKKHVNKLRILALLVFAVSAIKTIYSVTNPEIHYVSENATYISRIIFTDGLLLWPLVILFLAQIFAHGVEVQTDSDLTV